MFSLPFPRQTATLAALLLALTGCAGRTSPPAGEPEAVAPAPAASVPAPSYSAATLADLLVAEVSAQRNILGVTLGYYGREALSKRDPEVAEQAARLAAYLDDPLLTVELGEIWLAGDPDNAEAHELMAIARILSGDVEGAAGHIDVLLTRHPEQALMRLVAQARGLDSDGNAALLAALASLTERHPRQAPLWYARALHLQQQDRAEAALAACEKALSLNKQHEDALQRNGRLLDQQGQGLLDHSTGVIQVLHEAHRKLDALLGPAS